MMQTWSELFTSNVDLNFSVSSDGEFLTDFSSGRLGNIEHLDHRHIVNQRTLTSEDKV